MRGFAAMQASRGKQLKTEGTRHVVGTGFHFMLRNARAWRIRRSIPDKTVAFGDLHSLIRHFPIS
jgi:hypothetical protein